jgi:uncharacterized protein (TIGR04255 family)
MIKTESANEKHAMPDSPTTLPPFPDSERVVYRRNPLIEVICQLRFPPILRIAAVPPMEFQERIRAEYPLLSEQIPEINIQVPPEMPPAVADLLKGTLTKGKIIGYGFSSSDEKWKVTLTRDFLSLSTAEYTRWEHFREHLEGPLQALIAFYAPAFFTRVGLRYQDLIRRSALGLPLTTKWSELIRPPIAGVHGAPALEGSIEESLGQVLISLPQYGGRVRMNYGIVEAANVPEKCFLIDGDYYSEERTRTDDVDRILAYFNKQSGRLFRWCIEERLQQAMEPQPVTAAA